MITLAELDTSWFLGNAPGAAALVGRTADGAEVDLLPRTPLQPDHAHRFVLGAVPGVVAVRLAVFPDGGMARCGCGGGPPRPAVPRSSRHSAVALRRRVGRPRFWVSAQGAPRCDRPRRHP